MHIREGKLQRFCGNTLASVYQKSQTIQPHPSLPHNDPQPVLGIKKAKGLQQLIIHPGRVRATRSEGW